MCFEVRLVGHINIQRSFIQHGDVSVFDLATTHKQRLSTQKTFASQSLALLIGCVGKSKTDL